MAYTRINWEDLPSTATPRNATNLNKMDSAIKEHDDKLLGNTSMGNIIVDSISSKNLISGWYYGGLEATDGSENDNSNSRRTGFIEVDFSTTTNYYVSGMPTSSTNIRHFIAAYNSRMQFLGRTGGNLGSTENLTSSSFTSGTPQGTGTIKYLRVALYSGATDNDTTTVQLEKGSSATTFVEGKALGYISGSTANGNYIKYDDGTLVCYGKKDVGSIAFNTEVGNIYINSNNSHIVDITYPIAFLEEPQTALATVSSNNYMSISKARASSRMTLKTYLFTYSNTTINYIEISFYAIGRWK